jgi:hypothetical protein
MGHALHGCARPDVTLYLNRRLCSPSMEMGRVRSYVIENHPVLRAPYGGQQPSSPLLTEHLEKRLAGLSSNGNHSWSRRWRTAVSKVTYAE